MLSMTGSLKTIKVRLLMTNLADKLSQSLSQIQVQCASSQGVLTRVVGLTLEATGVNAPVGSYCDIISPSGTTLVAEVVGFGDGKLLLMPFGSVQGIAAGFKVKLAITNKKYGHESIYARTRFRRYGPSTRWWT